jgi:hypothetical protein
LKKSNLALSLLKIGCPLEIFKALGFKLKIYDVLAFDRQDVLCWLVQSNDVSIQSLKNCGISVNFIGKNCGKLIKVLENWVNIRGLLFVIKKKTNKISELPIGILKELVSYILI